MKVKELIEELKKYGDTVEIVISGTGYEPLDIDHFSKISRSDKSIFIFTKPMDWSKFDKKEGENADSK